MRMHEVFQTLAVPSGYPFFIRLDGRGFTALTNEHFNKPFDQHFHSAMCFTTESLVTEFGAVLGYTHSDEISLMFPARYDQFNCRVEKLVSLTAAWASVAFNNATLDGFGVFDARVICCPDSEFVEDYMSWRHGDGLRNSLSTALFWNLVDAGYTTGGATSYMNGLSERSRREKYAERTNGEPLASWKRVGKLIGWNPVKRVGENPKTGETVTAHGKTPIHVYTDVDRKKMLAQVEGLQENYRKIVGE